MATQDQPFKNPTLPQNPAATGSSVINSGPPVPNVGDIIARAQRAATPTPTPAPDAVNNMERYGTNFPGSLSANPSRGEVQNWRLFQHDNVGTGLIGGTTNENNMERYGTLFPASTSLNPTRGENISHDQYIADSGLVSAGRHALNSAVTELGQHAQTAVDYARQQHQMKIDSDTQGFGSVLHQLDPLGESYPQDLLQANLAFPHHNRALTSDMVSHNEKVRGQNQKDLEAAGAYAYEPTSHAAEDFKDTLSGGGSLKQAKARADLTSKAEGRLQKYFSNKTITPEDFGDQSTWASSGLFHSDEKDARYGKVNWDAVDKLAEKRGTDLVKPTDYVNAQRVYNQISKVAEADRTDEQKGMYNEAQTTIRKSLRQKQGNQPGLSANDLLRNSLRGQVSDPNAAPTEPVAPAAAPVVGTVNENPLVNPLTGRPAPSAGAIR